MSDNKENPAAVPPSRKDIKLKKLKEKMNKKKLAEERRATLESAASVLRSRPRPS